MTMTTRYRLLVFDWDGTLLDSIGPIVACTQAAMRELGVGAEGPSAAAIRDAIGLGLRESLELFFPGLGDDDLARVHAVYRDLWWGTYRDQTRLFPGVPALLARLEAAGYLLAVATAKSRRGLEHDLRATGVGPHFVATRTVDEAPSKPHPQMLLDLLDATGSHPHEAVMIGDTAHDLEMARAARVDSVAVASGSHPRERLRAAAPRALLPGVWELEAWLASGDLG
jgi:phosphoglycolate phosphatase